MRFILSLLSLRKKINDKIEELDREYKAEKFLAALETIRETLQTDREEGGVADKMFCDFAKQIRIALSDLGLADCQKRRLADQAAQKIMRVYFGVHDSVYLESGVDLKEWLSDSDEEAYKNL